MVCFRLCVTFFEWRPQLDKSAVRTGKDESNFAVCTGKDSTDAEVRPDQPSSLGLENQPPRLVESRVGVIANPLRDKHYAINFLDRIFSENLIQPLSGNLKAQQDPLNLLPPSIRGLCLGGPAQGMLCVPLCYSCQSWRPPPALSRARLRSQDDAWGPELEWYWFQGLNASEQAHCGRNSHFLMHKLLAYTRRARVALRPFVWKTFGPRQSDVDHEFSSAKS